MTYVVRELIVLWFGLFTFFVGIVFAKGVWSTLAAVLFFPYAWYLVVERVVTVLGWTQ